MLGSSGRGDNGQDPRFSCLWGRVEDFENIEGDKDDKEEEEENAVAASLLLFPLLKNPLPVYISLPALISPVTDT